MAQTARRLDRRKVAAPGALVLTLSLAACGQLELDRESGTDFPNSAMADGAMVTVPSIYEAIGIPLEVIEDEVVNVGNVGTPSCVSGAELDSFEEGHRGLPVAPTCPFCEFRLYGAILDRLYSGSDGSLPCEQCDAQGNGLCMAGLMWTENKRSFAIFAQHPKFVISPGYLVLVTAHEIAHALAVHHEDGNQDFDNPSIENDGLFFSQSLGNFEFTAQSREHIRDHPFACKWPGTGSFWEITAEHAGWPGHGGYDGVCP